MAKRRFYSAIGSGALAAVSLVALATLGGCGERPYPAPSHGAPPSAQPSGDLMGAPSASPYTAPPVVNDSPAYPPPPAPPAYDSGSVVAMAPIPNPGNGAPASGDGRIHSRYGAASPYGEGHWAPGHAAAPAYVPPRPPTAAAPAQTTADAAPAPTVQHKGALAAGAAAVAGAVALDAHHVATSVKQTATSTTTTTTTTKTTAAPATATGDRNTRLAALQTALTDAVGKTAVLTTPSSFAANQPSDVTLTLPTAFADTVKSEAVKQGLADEAASVSLVALLSGDGFAVTPSDEQAVTLKSGQATEYHWTVTAEPNAKGPLHADISANLLGGANEKLALGSVQKSAGNGIKLSPQIVGASILVLILAIVVVWLARGSGPTRSASARKASRQAARGGRPLDMTGSDAP